MSDGDEVRIIGIGGMPEVSPATIWRAHRRRDRGVRDRARAGDILVVTHKIVTKAEGRLVDLRTIEPSPLAQRFGERWDKDPRQVEVVLREARRIVRMDRGVIIAETAHGFVCANAGVDASNVRPSGVLLPIDPDASAAHCARRCDERFGFRASATPVVIVTDSFGRPWRNGIVNVAIGVSGMAPLADYRGETTRRATSSRRRSWRSRTSWRRRPSW